MVENGLEIKDVQKSDGGFFIILVNSIGISEAIINVTIYGK